MSGTLLFAPVLTAFADDGLSLPGAELYTYQAGTTTPAPAYLDEALTTAATNPVVADASGRIAPVYLDPALAYKVELREAPVVQGQPGALVWQADDYRPGGALGAVLADVEVLRAYGGAGPATLTDGSTWTTDGTTGHAGNEDNGTTAIVDGTGRLWKRVSGAVTDTTGQVLDGVTQAPRTLSLPDELKGLPELDQISGALAMATAPNVARSPANKTPVTFSSKRVKGYTDTVTTPFDIERMEPATRGYGVDIHTASNVRRYYELTGGIDGTAKAYLFKTDGTVVDVPISLVDVDGNTVDGAWYSAGNAATKAILADVGAVNPIIAADNDAFLYIWHEPGVIRFPEAVRSASVDVYINYDPKPGLSFISLTKNGAAVEALPFVAEARANKWQQAAHFELSGIRPTDSYEVPITYDSDDGTTLFLGENHCRVVVTPRHVMPPYPSGQIGKFRQGVILGGGQTIEDAATDLAKHDLFYATNFRFDETTGASGLTQRFEGQTYTVNDGLPSTNDPGIREVIKRAKAKNAALQIVPYLTLTAIAALGTFSGQFDPDRFSGPGPYSVSRSMFLAPFGATQIMSAKILIGNTYYGYFDGVTETSPGVYQHTVTPLGRAERTITFDTNAGTVDITPAIGADDDVWILHSENYATNGFIADQAGRDRLRALLRSTLSIAGLSADGLKLDLATATLLGNGNIDTGLRVIREIYDGPLHLNVTGRDVRAIRDLAASRFIRDGDVFIIEGAFIALGGSTSEGTLKAVAEVRRWQDLKGIRPNFLLTQASGEPLVNAAMTTALADMNAVRIASDIVSIEHSDLGIIAGGRAIGSPPPQVLFGGVS